jgi:hypothetical protein
LTAGALALLGQLTRHDLEAVGLRGLGQELRVGDVACDDRWSAD